MTAKDDWEVDNRLRLEDIAAAQGWMALGRDLAQAVATPTLYGCSSPEEVLVAVSKLRGSHPLALKKTMVAARFLAAHRPDILTSRDERVSMTQVHLLAQLFAVDPDLAHRHEASVYDGSMRYREMLRIVQEARRVVREEGRAPAADTARQGRQSRGRAFERAVSAYLEANVGDLLGKPRALIQRGQRLRPTPTDLVVIEDGETIAAIEIKAYRLETYYRQIFETAAVLAILKREFGQVWLIATPEWERNVPALVDTMRQLEVDGVRIAVFDPNIPNGEQPFRVVDA